MTARQRRSPFDLRAREATEDVGSKGGRSGDSCYTLCRSKHAPSSGVRRHAIASNLPTLPSRGCPGPTFALRPDELQAPPLCCGGRLEWPPAIVEPWLRSLRCTRHRARSNSIQQFGRKEVAPHPLPARHVDRRVPHGGRVLVVREISGTQKSQYSCNMYNYLAKGCVVVVLPLRAG
jgi:hypothetical protein